MATVAAAGLKFVVVDNQVRCSAPALTVCAGSARIGEEDDES